MDVFGDAWTSLIMGDAAQAVTRLDKFQKSLGVARNTLSDRLNKLVDSGVLVKSLYQDNPL
jgi:DNA-binding HxlR family transcriptional regulator